jgi:poly-beta-1,6-N-acetyl-D-glucosamine synthase
MGTDVSRRYCLISPCRNEERFLRRTLDSIVAQTVRPALWVVVDDGSTDGTPGILREYAERNDFIRIVRREDRGKRSVGPGVIDAFYAGYETIDPDSFEYVCKLDVDLDLPEAYFEGLMRRMEADPGIGALSGMAYYEDSKTGERISEKISFEMSVGASKFYRVECFREIGGFVREVMWDGIDCHRCRMFGWRTGSVDEEDVRFLHLRPMGSSDKGIFAGRMRHGYGQYFMGTGLTFMTASAVYRMTRPPYVLGGLAMLWGYVLSALRRCPRYSDARFRAALRAYQWDVLTIGRRQAVQRMDRMSHRQASGGGDAHRKLDFH